MAPLVLSLCRKLPLWSDDHKRLSNRSCTTPFVVQRPKWYLGLPMTTLKEFEDALRERGMEAAIAVLEDLRRRDRAKRSIAPARRITGRKMTPELAREILRLHASTNMTQQEIAFKLGVNQGRVNEVIKRGKWLSGDSNSPEAFARDHALARAGRSLRKKARSKESLSAPSLGGPQNAGGGKRARRRATDPRQLALDDL